MLGFTVAMLVSTLRSEMHIFACYSDYFSKCSESSHGELEKKPSATCLPPEWSNSFLLSTLLSTSVYLTSPSSHRLVTALWFWVTHIASAPSMLCRTQNGHGELLSLIAFTWELNFLVGLGILTVWLMPQWTSLSIQTFSHKTPRRNWGVWVLDDTVQMFSLPGCLESRRCPIVCCHQRYYSRPVCCILIEVMFSIFWMLLGILSIISEVLAFLLIPDKGGHIMYCCAVFPSILRNSQVVRFPAWVMYCFCW